LSAQSLDRRVLAGDGAVQFVFAAREGVCGDGARFIEDGFGGEGRIYENGSTFNRGRDELWPSCFPGPVRVVASVTSGEIVRLRTYAGPVRSTTTSVRDLGVVPVADAVAFLTRLIEGDKGRVGEQAVLPFVLADSTSPWPTLLRVARDDKLSRGRRSNVSFWLSRGAAFKLGLTDQADEPDDDVRSSAVFALSQQHNSEAIPQLLELARHSKHPAVRAQALFWLGQSHDRRAIDYFGEVLGGR
jgi:hypothetical protein